MQILQFFNSSILKGIALLLCLPMLFPTFAGAQTTYTWNGAANSSSFSNPSNWDLNNGNYPHTYTDNIVIPSSVCGSCAWPTITGTPACNNLTFSSGGSQIIRLNFQSSGTLNIFGNFDNSSGQVDVMGDSTNNQAKLTFKGVNSTTFSGTTLLKTMTIDKDDKNNNFNVKVSVTSGRPEVTHACRILTGYLEIGSTAGLKLRAKQGSTTNECLTAYLEDGLYGLSGAGTENTFVSQYVPPQPYDSNNPNGYCYHFLGSPVDDGQFYKHLITNMNKYASNWYNSGYAYPSGSMPAVYHFYEPEYDTNHGDGIDEMYGWLGTDGTGSPGTVFGPADGVMIHYAPKRANRVIDWVGTPLSGPINQTYRYTNHSEPDNDGKNLAGNPFAAPLDWAPVWADNEADNPGGVSSVITIWYAEGDISNTGTLLFFDADPEADPGANTHNGVLAIGQGFCLQVAANNTNVYFNPEHRVYDNTITSFRKAVPEPKPDNLGIAAEMNGNKAFTSLIANNKYSKGFDPTWDHGHMAIPGQAVRLYTRLNGVNYTSNKFDLNRGITEVDLVIESEESGNVTLQPYHQSFSEDNYHVYIKDRELNRFIKLEDKESTYTYPMKAGSTGKRFALVVADASVTEEQIRNYQPSPYQVFVSPGQIKVESSSIEDETIALEVTDLTGRQVLTQSVELLNGKGNVSLPTNLMGIYLTKVKGLGGSVSNKVVIR